MGSCFQDGDTRDISTTRCPGLLNSIRKTELACFTALGSPDSCSAQDPVTRGQDRHGAHSGQLCYDSRAKVKSPLAPAGMDQAK